MEQKTCLFTRWQQDRQDGGGRSRRRTVDSSVEGSWRLEVADRRSEERAKKWEVRGLKEVGRRLQRRRSDAVVPTGSLQGREGSTELVRFLH